MKFFCGIATRLIFYLQEIFETYKTALCCFLDAEYHYRGSDQQTGETWNVSLSKQIALEEKIWLKDEKKQLLGPFPPEKLKKNTMYLIF